MEAMQEKSLESVKVEPRSTSRLSSALFILPLFYLRDENLRALTCVGKNASVDINLQRFLKTRFLLPGIVGSCSPGYRSWVFTTLKQYYLSLIFHFEEDSIDANFFNEMKALKFVSVFQY